MAPDPEPSGTDSAPGKELARVPGRTGTATEDKASSGGGNSGARGRNSSTISRSDDEPLLTDDRTHADGTAGRDDDAVDDGTTTDIVPVSGASAADIDSATSTDDDEPPVDLERVNAEAADDKALRAGRSRRGMVWFGTLIALLAMMGIGWYLGSRSQSPEQAAARAEAPEASWITATVESRKLAATVIQRGDVAPEAAVSVGVPASVEGDPVITEVDVAAGESVDEGAKVVVISGRPVFVMTGAVPVYRTLRPTMSGADVHQLQEALTRLGYTPENDGLYGAQTKAAVEAFYKDAGFEPVPSSTTEAVDLATAEQSVSEAQRALDTAKASAASSGGSQTELTQAQVAVDQATRGVNDAVNARSEANAAAERDYNNAVQALNEARSNPEATEQEIREAQSAVDNAAVARVATARAQDNAVSDANDALRVAKTTLQELLKQGNTTSAQRDVAAAEEALAAAKATLTTTQESSGPTVPQGEIVFLPSFPARVTAAQATVGAIGSGGGGGGGGGDGQPAAGGGASTAATSALELAVGNLVVNTTISAGDVGLLRNGMKVELLDEATSTTYPATITQLAEEPTSGADGALAYPAVIVPDKPLPDSLTGSNLRVTATTASTETEALVVPIAAVSSGADGNTRVSVVDGPNGIPTDVEVKAGLSADGFVAIEPVVADSIKAGDLVVIGQ